MSSRRGVLGREKRTAEAIQQEVQQEVARLLQVIFSGWRKSGGVDLEAVEMVVRGGIRCASSRY